MEIKNPGDNISIDYGNHSICIHRSVQMVDNPVYIYGTKCLENNKDIKSLDKNLKRLILDLLSSVNGLRSISIQRYVIYLYMSHASIYSKREIARSAVVSMLDILYDRDRRQEVPIFEIEEDGDQCVFDWEREQDSTCFALQKLLKKEHASK